MLVVIGEEYEWIKYASDALVVAYPEELEFVIDEKGILTFYYAKKEVKPSAVLWRNIDENQENLKLLRALDNPNICTLNKPEIVMTGRNPFKLLLDLSNKGIPIPKTVCISGKRLPELNFNYPAVLKAENIHRGERKAFVKDEETLHEILAFAPANDTRYLLQEFLHVENDYRVLMIDGKIIDVMERVSENWIKSHDAEARKLPITIPQLSEIAMKTYKLFKADIMGVDIVRTEDDKYWLLEVVTEPSFKVFGDEAYKAVIDLLHNKYKINRL